MNLIRLFQYTIHGLRELTNRLQSSAYLQKLNSRSSKRPTYTLEIRSLEVWPLTTTSADFPVNIPLPCSIDRDLPCITHAHLSDLHIAFPDRNWVN